MFFIKMKKIFSLLLLCCSVFSYAQTQNTIDSLENTLKTAKGDNKITTLQKLSVLYLNESPQKAFETAYKSFYYTSFSTNSTLLSDAYYTIGYLHSKTSSLDSAKFYFNKALQTSETNEQTAKVLDNLGIIYRELSNYDSSLVCHEQALKLEQVIGDREAISVCYKNIGNVHMQMAQYEDALEYYKLACEQRSTENDQKAIASLYNNMSNALVELNQYGDALSYLTQAVDLQAQIGDKADEAYTLNGIGNFYFRLKVYDKAQEYYTKALDLRLQVGDKNDIAASQFNIATVHRDLGNYREALKYYEQALELRKQTDNKEAQALIYNAIGGTYKNQKAYQKAIDNYFFALEINEKIGGKKNIASSYERLGMIYKDTCLYDKAANYYQKAIQEYLAIGDTLNVGRMYNFYGNLNKEKGDMTAAMQCYEKAMHFYQHNTLGLAYTTFNQGKITNSESHYTRALGFAEQCEEKTLVRDILFALYTLKKQQNNTEQSLSYYERFVALKDSIENDKNRERIAELEFESDIKVLEHENENQLLRLHEEELKNTQIHTLIGFLCLILLAILGFFIILYKQLSQKKNAFNLLTQKQLEVESAYSDVKKVNEALAHKNSQITDSLTYAKRIQKSILPSETDIATVFPQHFIYYLPKEIVSGDFYWFSQTDSYVFFAAIDCTGHGVPGACMSMVGNTLLNQIINESKITSPAEILNQLDSEVIKTLHQNGDNNSQEDGMAISLIRYDKSKSEIVFAGAGQKILIHQNNELQEYTTSLYSIGGMHAYKQTKNITFEEIVIPVETGATIYLYSDGYADQFGHEKNERFSSQKFKQMIADMQAMDMSEQFMNVSRTFDAWKGSEKQIDDILVVGLKL